MDVPKSVNEICEYRKNEVSICILLDQLIDEHLCAGKPVILKVESTHTVGGKHFLTVDGQKKIVDSDTMSILDPDCRVAPEEKETLLGKFSNLYKGIRLYSAETETGDPSEIIVYLGSPATYYVSDQFGSRTGLDPLTGERLREIPNSNILDESVEDPDPLWVVYLGQPDDGDYDIHLVGTGSGPFTVRIETYDLDDIQTTKQFTGTILPDRQYSYGVVYSSVPGSSDFIIAKTYDFLGFGEPLSSEIVKVFKFNRTIPVKFKIARQDGAPHDDIVAKLVLQQVDDSIPNGEPIEPDSSGEANTDGFFRYDTDSDQYIYNLSTKDLTSGTWDLEAKFDDGSMEKIRIGLK